jgi:hypothetical protein
MHSKYDLLRKDQIFLKLKNAKSKKEEIFKNLFLKIIKM